MLDANGDYIVQFAPNQRLPEGWRVVQLDSGHYMGTNDRHDTAITVNRFHARKWAIQIASQHNAANGEAKP